ncbi:MAG: hypothetical protein ACR5LD_04900 [Symbiopectobacterium sp.]
MLQDWRNIIALALLNRDDPFQPLVTWNNLPKKTEYRYLEPVKGQMAGRRKHL